MHAQYFKLENLKRNILIYIFLLYASYSVYFLLIDCGKWKLFPLKLLLLSLWISCFFLYLDTVWPRYSKNCPVLTSYLLNRLRMFFLYALFVFIESLFQKWRHSSCFKFVTFHKAASFKCHFLLCWWYFLLKWLLYDEIHIAKWFCFVLLIICMGKTYETLMLIG